VRESQRESNYSHSWPATKRASQRPPNDFFSARVSKLYGLISFVEGLLVGDGNKICT
jgi:hypothetical protein